MEYHGYLFTTHAQERLRLRSISWDDAIRVLQKPDRTAPTDKATTTKFIRQLHQRQIEVVATYLKDQKKWLIVSVWVRGESDPTPLIWQLLTLPFRLAWWLLRMLIKFARSEQGG